jgi:hypothetical protein
MWCLPLVLDHLDMGIDSILGGMGVVFTKIGRLFYIHIKNYSWMSQNMENVLKLLSTWCVCLEESVRPNSFPLEHVVGEPSFLFHDHLNLQVL